MKIDRTELVQNGKGATAMIHNTDDLRIREIKELLPPGHVIREFPATEKAATTVYRAREAIHRIHHNESVSALFRRDGVEAGRALSE